MLTYGNATHAIHFLVYCLYLIFVAYQNFKTSKSETSQNIYMKYPTKSQLFFSFLQLFILLEYFFQLHSPLCTSPASCPAQRCTFLMSHSQMRDCLKAQLLDNQSGTGHANTDVHFQRRKYSMGFSFSCFSAVSTATVAENSRGRGDWLLFGDLNHRGQWSCQELSRIYSA